MSNIADSEYLGIRRTLEAMLPLLQSPQDNPHATLIIMFKNAVDEAMTEEDKLISEASKTSTMRRVLWYLPIKRIPSTIFDGDFFRFMTAFDLFRKKDAIFDRYVQNQGPRR